jgi:SAM-dependent methyltransferase
VRPSGVFLSETAPPSAFFSDHIGRIRAAAQRGAVLDLACGRGRHTLALARAGLPVIGIDRNSDSLSQLRIAAGPLSVAIDTVRADLESPSAIPLRGQSCGAVLVFRYLHRPLAQEISRVLAPGGLLVYETFTIGNAEFGCGPRNPSHLLEPGELPKLFPDLEILERWEGVRQLPEPAAIGQLIAQKR